jgi:hypothetical protein
MTSMIDYLNYKPAKNDMLRTYTWLDTKYVYLPNVVGMNINEAKKELKNFKLEYSGTGETIIAEEPTGNLMVKENSIVKIMLN